MNDEETASWMGNDADSMKPFVRFSDEYITKWVVRPDNKCIREEIVRCRDCKHYVEDPEPIDQGWPMMCEDTGRDMVEPNGFCAWGERAVDA